MNYVIPFRKKKTLKWQRKELRVPRNMQVIRRHMQDTVTTQFNDMLAALSIFDKHWDTMGTTNQDVIWQYLKVLCILSEKATHAI
jgi:hypothetical protein